MEKGNFSIQDAGFNVGVNVRITKRDKMTGRVIEERKGHNRCLKMQLMGIVKWLNGEFNPTQSYLSNYDWIPRYLGVGTNTATSTTPPGIGSEVTIDDTRLLNEISPRLKLPERNKVINRSSQSYIQLVIATYLPEELYVNETISEAGLFSQETGNNCLFRIAFEPIKKTTDSVVEVNWTISVISVESENKPYEELDKDDLRQQLEHLLDRISELYPKASQACTDMKEGIYIIGKKDSTQTEVDKITKVLADDYNDLSTAQPVEDLTEIIESVDDINGEVI